MFSNQGHTYVTAVFKGTIKLCCMLRQSRLYSNILEQVMFKSWLSTPSVLIGSLYLIGSSALKGKSYRCCIGYYLQSFSIANISWKCSCVCLSLTHTLTHSLTLSLTHSLAVNGREKHFFRKHRFCLLIHPVYSSEKRKWHNIS